MGSDTKGGRRNRYNEVSHTVSLHVDDILTSQNSLVYGKNQDATLVPWPKWNKLEFEQTLMNYHCFLNIVYSEGDWKDTALPDMHGDVLLMPDSGLYMLDKDLLGLVENLDDISDSSDDDDSSSDDEAPSKKRKRGVKPSDGNQKKRAKGDDDVMGKGKGKEKREESDTSDQENNGGKRLGSTKGKPKLSAYELTSLENIERIKNNLVMKKLNDGIRQIHKQRDPPAQSRSLMQRNCMMPH